MRLPLTDPFPSSQHKLWSIWGISPWCNWSLQREAAASTSYSSHALAGRSLAALRV